MRLKNARKHNKQRGNNMVDKKEVGKKIPVKRKAPTKKRAVAVNKTKEPSKFSNKTELEKEEIKCIISIGIRKSNSVAMILEDLKAMNKSVSMKTVYIYVKEIRAQWRSMMSENYETHVATQYAKLELMEERLWLMLDKSMNPEEVKTTSRQSGRVLTEDIKTTSSHGDVEIMKMIERIWVRRNEILGITSSTINIQNNIQNTIEQTNIENKVEVTKVEFKPVSDKFFGNFVIEVADRVKP